MTIAKTKDKKQPDNKEPIPMHRHVDLSSTSNGFLVPVARNLKRINYTPHQFVSINKPELI
jgi:hypothetical protein